MDIGVHGALRRMGYVRARRLTLGAGLGVLLVTAALMYLRRVDSVEVLATLLFVPVFVGLLFWRVAGGALLGLAAAAAYAALRYPAIEAIGADRFAGLVLGRGAAYLAFGVIGGWASRELESSVRKLELYDHIDDTTGLFNARFFVAEIDVETSRAHRYQTLFSVAVVDAPAAPFRDLPPKRRAAVLRELGRTLATSVRTVDRAVHGEDGRTHRLAVILPETGPEGARIFVDRLAERVAAFLSSRGVAVEPGALSRSVATFPGEDEAIAGLRVQFAEIDRAEHPDAQPGEG